MFLKYFWDNIGQVEAQWNVGWEGPDNIAWEKILCCFVLTLLRQYYTDKS